ncbi:hypothetical protein SAMD00019534_053210 [Acytostelium subglobosum LB1]|uniref:hypothetical protein n=1 Tax=Acytostelium subglobosum LB1 TaxID=1410327 RepID=UPI000644E3CA|nr:hypothetical protein SAMD00019534_053210 [Acytostelium subglobosum LB1]GAM22146.1 hypothetical protein SAMD00019534_053210 [Acytostelium subglobosum LB1]|eukprot:XP_012755246.1 hypothetical protein SAMD00019534_053210 [Acytostelium subglobosum LB1]
MLGFDAPAVNVTSTDIGDDQLLVYVKLFGVSLGCEDIRDMALREYILSGDFMLITYLHDQLTEYDEQISNYIVELGNVAQMAVLLGYLDTRIIPRIQPDNPNVVDIRRDYFIDLHRSLFKAPNQHNALEVIKYLNNNNVVQKTYSPSITHEW